MCFSPTATSPMPGGSPKPRWHSARMTWHGAKSLPSRQSGAASPTSRSPIGCSWRGRPPVRMPSGPSCASLPVCTMTRPCCSPGSTRHHDANSIVTNGVSSPTFTKISADPAMASSISRSSSRPGPNRSFSMSSPRCRNARDARMTRRVRWNGSWPSAVPIPTWRCASPRCCSCVRTFPARTKSSIPCRTAHRSTTPATGNCLPNWPGNFRKTTRPKLLTASCNAAVQHRRPIWNAWWRCCARCSRTRPAGSPCSHGAAFTACPACWWRWR